MASSSSMETKIIYHLDDQDTPYLVKLATTADRVTLLDLKTALSRPNYKYFFKSMDDDFGVVKEEIFDDSAILPSFNGRIVTWLVAAENSVLSEPTNVPEHVTQVLVADRSHQHHHHHHRLDEIHPSSAPSKRGGGGGGGGGVSGRQVMNSDSKGGLPSSTTTSAPRPGPASRPRHNQNRWPHHHKPGSSSVMSSDIESTSFVDSEDDASTRVSTTTDTTNASSYYNRRQRRSRRKIRHPVLSQASSFSSVTDSTMSLNIITVSLNMEASSFLGISIVGQTSKGGDGGIYIGSIMKGGVVAQDGRIEPGDMLLEVNGTSFENMSNDEAVRTLREAVRGPGPITLVLAKCWDPNPKGYFAIPRQEPARPLDPSAWVLHTQTVRGMWGAAPGLPCGGGSSVTSSGSSVISSMPDSDFVRKRNHFSASSSSSQSSRSHGDLNKHSDMATIVRAMARPDSGLEVRDRTWLKITIKRSFIGSDLVDWLFTRVSGFSDRRDARRYACNLLKAGFIQHTVNKVTFSEQCYYVFLNSLATDLAALSINDLDSVSSIGDHDRRAFDPLPPVPKLDYNLSRLHSPVYLPSTMPATGFSGLPSAPYNFIPGANSYISMPGVNGAESVVSSSAKRDQTCACIVTHTYKQIRKLWDNSDKSVPSQNAAKMIGKFDADIDRSTSSDSESSDSDGRDTKDEKKKDGHQPEAVAEPCRRQSSSVDKVPVDGQGDGDAEVVEEMGDL